MRILTPLLFILLAQAALAEDTSRQDIEAEIGDLIRHELWGHYDVLQVSILDTEDHTAEWGGAGNGYGIRRIVARFIATRNGEWHTNLNREVLADNCGNTGVWLLCQPTGHRLEGKVEVDVVATIGGWKALSRNFRNRREFPLSNYLLLEGRAKEGYVLPPIEDAR